MDTQKFLIKHLQSRSRLKQIFGAAILISGLLFGAQNVSAQAVSGPTVTNDVCMQQIYGGDTVTNANRLNCTASDIKIAKAISALNLDTGTNTCILGQTFDLYATFQVNVTANERYDAAFFFRIDGGADARNPDGHCSASILRNPAPGDPNLPVLNLDNDTCGDLNSGSYTNISFIIPDVKCEAATDPATGQTLDVLKLPNCTSWHSNAQSVCSGVPTAGPETKSKCNCDDNFTVPIIVEKPDIGVTKVAKPTSLDEPGGQVTFTVTVTNPAQFTSVTLTSLVDDPDNDPNTNNSVTFNATSNPTLAQICTSTNLAPGGSTTCSFTRTITGNAGQSFTDKACVSGTDSNGSLVGPKCATASVSIKDVKPTATVVKSIDSLLCAEMRFKVKVTNTDAAESLSLTKLEDDKFGNIATGSGQPALGAEVTATDCVVPKTIAKNGGFYECTFDANVCKPFPHTDTVTGTLSDDENNTITPSGSATISNVTYTTP